MLQIVETKAFTISFFNVKDGERTLNNQPLTSREEAELLVYKATHPIPQFDREIALRVKKSDFYLLLDPKFAVVLQAYNQYSLMPSDEYVKQVLRLFPEVGSDTLVNGKVQKAIEAHMGYPDANWIRQSWITQTGCYYNSMVPTKAIMVNDTGEYRPVMARGGYFASSAWIECGHCNHILGSKFGYYDFEDQDNWMCHQREVRPMTQQEWDAFPIEYKQEF